MNKPTEKKLKTYVLMLAKTMPMTHSAAGQPTDFHQKIIDGKKLHTLRNNYNLWALRIDEVNRGEAIISVREWSDRPYKSKQRELFQLAAGEVRLSSARKLDADTWLIDDFQRITVTQLAYNDGLDRHDFIDWFKNVGRHNVFACIHFLKFQ